MNARTIIAIALLMSMTVASNAEVTVNGKTYYDTYIYDVLQSGQSPLVLTCQDMSPDDVLWNSRVTGPIYLNANVSIHGVTITNAGGRLMFSTFIPELSGVYICLFSKAEVASILLTTNNPSLNILSQQPVKLYNDAMQFQLLISSYFSQNYTLEPIPSDNIFIQYYVAARRENITVTFEAIQSDQGSYELTVYLRDAVLPNETIFFILVDHNGNGSTLEMAFVLTKVALYLTPIPAEIIALVGDNVTIDCSPSDPAIEVRITFLQSENQDPRLLSNEGTYNLVSAVKNNSGNYTCVGSARTAITQLADNVILTETVHITVLPDPVAIEFNGNIVANVSIINSNNNSANLTCLGTKGNSRLQWRTQNDDIDNDIRNAYQKLSDRDGAAVVANQWLTIINSANKTMLIIYNVNQYSGSFFYCTSLESGRKALTLITQANPFVIAHPDLPPDAALGQSFEMIFVVGFNSDGTKNNLLSARTAAAQITLLLHSTVVNSTVLFTELPFAYQYLMPISTASEGNYTFTVDILHLRKKAETLHFLTVVVPSISVTSSPMNVLQSILANISCIPSDTRAPIVWQYFNTSSNTFNDITNESPYNMGHNGYWLSFYTLLNPASLQELNLPSLPNPSLGIIKPSPNISTPHLRTQGSLNFSCSLVNGTTDKVLSQYIQLNTLRDSVQMLVKFTDGSLVTLFNDTTINNAGYKVQIEMLDCLALNGLGTLTLQKRSAGIDQLLQPITTVGNIIVLSTAVSISVRVVSFSDQFSMSSGINGYYKCSVSDGNISVVNITGDNNLFTNEGSSMINLPLGSIGLVYFQLAINCFNGLNNDAFSLSNQEFIIATLHSPYNLNTSIETRLSQYSFDIPLALFVVGPTRLAIYMNPVRQIHAGVYSIRAGLEPVLTTSVTINTTVPVLSVQQSQVQVLQFKTTQISCIPSQDDVQIQWTFISNNAVLYTGYEHSYTITEASLFDEGIYMCSVYGTNDSSIIKPQTVYVNVIAVCLNNYAAGVVWKAAFENQTVWMPCSDANPKFSPVTQMSQHCLPSGQWAAVDFTTCTLLPGVKRPFTLYWSSLMDEFTFRDERFFISLIPGINITAKTVNISSSMLSQSGSSFYAVLISADFNDQQLINFYPFTPTKRLVSRQSLSYAAIWPSDLCRCKQGYENYFYLCSNVLSSPCNCISSTQCQCVPPFVGDGEFCTLDSDLDGTPDIPLNCTGYTYCEQDNCSHIYNPPMDGIQSDACSGKLIVDGCQPTYDTIWGLKWPNIPVNFTYAQPCPNGGIHNVSGKTYRFCSSTGDWGPTDVTQCESYTYKYLTQQVLLPSLEVPQGLGIVATLFGYTQPQPISILPLDLKNSIIIISTVLNLLVTNFQQGRVPDVQDTVIILDVINNLLNESNIVGWQILQTVNPNAASPLLLKSAESYGLYVASVINTNTTISLSRSSVVLQASKVKTTTKQADLKFPNEISSLFANASFSSIDASIVIPGELLLERANQSTSVPVVNMIIKNINTFLPSNRGATYISQQVDALILSSQVGVADGGFASIALKARPVSITFRLSNPNNGTTQVQCSFWNFSSSSWSSEGMLPPTSNGSFVQCYSTHLTSFAVLLAVENFPDSEALTIISYIGCGISMTGLLATILFFLTFRKQLLEKPHYFIHLNLAIALFLAFLIFVAGVETATHNEAACKVVAALLQYFWLSAFCWMLCEGVMLYLMLVVVFSSLKNKVWFFFLLGWLPPLLFVVIGLAVRSDYYVVRGKDGKTISYCWMSTAKGTIWAFAAPVVIILLVNVAFLMMVLVVLFRKGRPKVADAKLTKDNRSVVVYLIKSTIILLPVLGCTWLFGLLSINQYTLVFTWLFTILNSLQGVFLCIET